MRRSEIAPVRDGPPDPSEGSTRATTARFDARRNEVIDIAASLFARNSYAATSVAEISSAARLGKGGLYHYIGSKEELLVEINARVMQPLMDVTERITRLTASPAVRLRLVSEALLRLATDRADHIWVFLHEHRVLTGALLVDAKRRRRAFEDAVEGLFSEGVTAGEMQIDDLRLTTLAFLGIHNSAYQWVRPDGRLTPELISATYFQIFLQGVARDGRAVEESRQQVAGFRHLLDDLIS